MKLNGEVYPGVTVDAFHGIPADDLSMERYQRVCLRCCHRAFEPPRVCVRCARQPASLQNGPGCETCMEPCAECQQMVCGIHSSTVPDGRFCDVCRGGL